MTKRLFLHLIILISIFIASCGPSAGSPGTSSEVQAWIDQPVTGSTIPLAPFTLKAHARHSAGSGITKIVFLVNSVPVAEVDTDATQPIVYAEAGWNPLAAGLYQIQSQAFAGDTFNYSDVAWVCVSEQAKATSNSFESECDASDIVVPQVEITKEDTTPPPSEKIQFKLEATPTPVYYGSCTTEPTTATFNIFADSVDGVANLRIKYILIDAGGVNEIATDATLIPATGATEYSATFDVNAFASPHLAGSTGYLSAYAFALDSANNEIGFGTFNQLQILPCVQQVPPQNNNNVPPTATNTPTQQQNNNPPPVVDTTPPLVDPSLSTLDVYYITGCGLNTLTVNAYVEDASGIQSVTLIYGYVGSGTEGIFVNMVNVGGNNYQATINVGNEAYNFLQGANGEISIYVEAIDNAGNTGNATDGPVTVWFCPG